MSAIIWFELNYMKLNQDNCHFLLFGHTPEYLWARIGEHIWESQQEKLLWLIIDKNLTFDADLSNVCKKESSKVTALARLVKLILLKRKEY